MNFWILGDSHDDCNEFYCCDKEQCHVGTYERLLKQAGKHEHFAILKEPYRKISDHTYEKQVNCTGFVYGEGLPLFEFSLYSDEDLVPQEKPKEMKMEKIKQPGEAVKLKESESDVKADAWMILSLIIWSR